MGRKRGGFRPWGAGIQFDFRWQGKRYRPTLELAPTPPNLKYAQRLLDEMLGRIASGSFSMRDYFPNYKHAEVEADAKITFRQYADLYLAAKRGSLAPSAYRMYENRVNNLWCEKFGERDVRTIKHSELLAFMGEREWSEKTRNNCLTMLRGVLDLALRDRLIEESPASGIEFLQVQRDEPDPFTLAEADAIVAKLRERSEVWADFYLFAFETGLRPSEQIALRWSKVDMPGRRIRIEATRVLNVGRNRTKTATGRWVRLTGAAHEALARQQARSRLIGDDVWLNPTTGKPLPDDQVPRRAFQIALQRVAGVRVRGPYHTRHTRATALLMAGVRPALAARELGHSVRVFLTIYARWLESDDDASELAKADRSVTARSQASAK